MSDWTSDAHYRSIQKAAPCWACKHYERKELLHDGLHRCYIAMPEFPKAGKHCRCWEPEPGADPNEAYR